MIDELRQMGNDALTAGAERGVEKSVGVAQAESDWRPGGKKTVWVHPLWSDRGDGTGIERPFSAVAGVSCRCRSLPLQRVMTDFGADHALAPAAAKLKEHYGIERPVSSVPRTTEHHAECIDEQAVARVIEPGTAAGLLIGEMDGSMVPVVEPSPATEDPCKGQVLSWKEVRLNRVHPQGRVTPVFGGNFVGGVEESGR